MATGSMAVLDRLSQLVKRAEAEVLSDRVYDDLVAAGGKLLPLAEALDAAVERQRAIPPLRTALKADRDTLDTEVKRLARVRSQTPRETLAEIDEVLKAAEAEIAARSQALDVEVKEAAKAHSVAVEQAKGASASYHRLRLELARLAPERLAEVKHLDEAAARLDGCTLRGRVERLLREIEQVEPYFETLKQREQYLQVKVWIGKVRLGQAEVAEADETADEVEALSEILQTCYKRLRDLSRQHTPGYIEAFRLNFEPINGWADFVKQAVGELRQYEEEEAAKRTSPALQQEKDAKKETAAAKGRKLLDDLQDLVAYEGFPDEEGDEGEFRSLVAGVIAGLGVGDAELQALVKPYLGLLDGDEFASLRHRIQNAGGSEDAADLRTAYGDVVKFMTGKTCVYVGGTPREDSRKQHQLFFGCRGLEWVAGDVSVRSLLARCRNGSIDVVVLLAGYLGHNVSDSVKKACAYGDVPCVIVSQGYGVKQVAAGLRTVLADRKAIEAAVGT